MSASTVSITGNPAPATRRRPVVADRKKQSANNVDIFPSSDHPQTNGDASAGGAADGKNVASGVEKLTVAAAANSRDVSHQSVLGDGLFERNSKDLAHLKKSVNDNSTVSPRRGGRKSSAGKVERPRWLTVLSVFSKNFVLLLVLLGIVQLVKNLAMRNEVGKVSTELGLNEFEGRITEVEGLVKTTAKMMQMQLEVADSKIEREIGGLRREMVKNIDEKTGSIESKLKEVELRSEGLEKDVKELKSGNWVTKDEFDKVYEELKKGKGGIGNLDLDEIRLHAREVVEKEIEKHAADGLGRVDYALGAGGAFVLKHSDPVVTGRSGNWFLNGLRKGVHSDAEKILKPSFGEPGQCFALKGSSGFVLIRLRTAIVPEAVTLEHVSKNVAYDRSTAPKDCRVSGWLQGTDIDLQVSTEKIHLLAKFTYDVEKSNAQTFKVVDSTPSGLVDTVRLDFTTNQGNPSLTCIYRFRVHGHEADPASMMALQP